MSIAGQRLDPQRYALIPRTLAFLYDEDRVLLQQVPASKGEWAGRYNGVGGHVERGEDPLTAARREIREETGLEPASLVLCGVAAVDIQVDLGIGLYVFGGRVANPILIEVPEGSGWFRRPTVMDLPLVEDLPILIPAVEAALKDGSVFSAVYQYDSDGALKISMHGASGAGLPQS